MHLFYTQIFNGDTTVLGPAESAHCIRVLRFKKGDIINLIDGNGSLLQGNIEYPDSNECRVTNITNVQKFDRPRKSLLHVAIAPTKSIDRFEWFIEKAVEIGVDIITPMLCQRSERRIVNAERIEKLIISTMKQAKIFYKPIFKGITAYNQLLRMLPENLRNRYIALCSENLDLLVHQPYNASSETIVLIGPEGDFTEEEVIFSREQKFIPVSLGPNRLRTETAGIVACNIINNLDQSINNDKK